MLNVNSEIQHSALLKNLPSVKRKRQSYVSEERQTQTLRSSPRSSPS